MSYAVCRRPCWIALVALLGLARVSLAEKPATGPATGPASVAPEQFDFKALLPGPPADDSQAHREEVERMLALQEGRSAEEVARCKAEVDLTAFAFASVLGTWFTADELPQTASVMKDAAAPVRSVVGAAKKLWNRTRPPVADERIHPCVPLEKTPSYPSSHAARGIVWATCLAEIFPEHKDELMARGKQIGDDRFLAGMHYPSDVAAGQTLGAEIAKRLLADESFRARLARAKDECLADAKAHH